MKEKLNRKCQLDIEKDSKGIYVDIGVKYPHSFTRWDKYIAFSSNTITYIDRGGPRIYSHKSDKKLAFSLFQTFKNF